MDLNFAQVEDGEGYLQVVLMISTLSAVVFSPDTEGDVDEPKETPAAVDERED